MIIIVVLDKNIKKIDVQSYNISIDLLDGNINEGCEKYRSISGLDEMALPCEIGLYFDFNVTDDGIPYGCPGLDNFNPTMWNISNIKLLLSFHAHINDRRTF